MNYLHFEVALGLWIWIMIDQQTITKIPESKHPFYELRTLSTCPNIFLERQCALWISRILELDKINQATHCAMFQTFSRVRTFLGDVDSRKTPPKKVRNPLTSEY